MSRTIYEQDGITLTEFHGGKTRGPYCMQITGHGDTIQMTRYEALNVALAIVKWSNEVDVINNAKRRNEHAKNEG